MPDELKFEGDKQFFTAALDRADLIVHGRHSFEDQPNSPQRKRLVLTRDDRALAPDPSNPKATLWNPAGALVRSGLRASRRRLRHRRDHRRARRVRHVHGPLRHVLALAGAAGADARWRAAAFPACPRNRRRQILAAHGLKAGEAQMLDAAHRRQRHAVAARDAKRARPRHKPVQWPSVPSRPYPAMMNSAPMIDRFFSASISDLGVFRRRLIPEIVEIEGRRGDEENQQNGEEPRARN